MTTEKLERLLVSIGKAAFVKYYATFQNCSREACIASFEEDYTERAKASRTGHAQAIFRAGMEREALTIIANSPRVEALAVAGARELLKKEFPTAKESTIPDKKERKEGAEL